MALFTDSNPTYGFGPKLTKWRENGGMVGDYCPCRRGKVMTISGRPRLGSKLGALLITNDLSLVVGYFDADSLTSFMLGARAA